ncbi:MAG: hypothetical protein QOG20_5255, partial [Pseudonocardiales bacterium]|nr:hypothetical protein [Pseudonocardiales bacterium]
MGSPVRTPVQERPAAMNEPSPAEEPVPADCEPPRLGPRPLSRPVVDEGIAQVFGRPEGVEGGFASPPGSTAAPRTTLAPPPAPAPPPSPRSPPSPPPRAPSRARPDRAPGYVDFT